MQLDLFDQDFAPISGGAKHYVPVLQNKSGELEALRRAAPGVWDHMTPLLAVAGPKKPRMGSVTIQISFAAVRSWVKKLASAVMDRPFFLDILRFKPGTPLYDDQHSKRGPRRTRRRQFVLEQIYEFAHGQRLNFVPVYQANLLGETYSKIMRCAITEVGRGFALRYPLLGTISLGRPCDLALKIVEDLGEATDSVDLMLDLGWIPPDTELDLELTRELISGLAHAATWRNVILIGSSMPSSLSCVREGTVGEIPRSEWGIWSNLRHSGMPNLVFGDYGIQHPKPPAEGGPGMRANIRYTTHESTIVARGGQVLIEGNESYRRLCSQLIGHEAYQGDSFSWGDSEIKACAGGHKDPGGQQQWRAVGTSHHLAFVTQQLQNLP